MKSAYITTALLFSTSFVFGQCDFSDDYSSATPWTQVGTNVEVSGGKVQFISGSTNGQQRRIFRALGTTFDSTDFFTARFEFTPASVGTQNNQPSTGHRLLALTAGTQEPFNDCPDVPCTGMPAGTQDGIVALFLSRNPADGDLFFLLKAKDGIVEYTSSENIIAPNLNVTYYLQMDRLSPTIIRLSVFSNSSFSNHISGSPIYDTIPSTVDGLNTVQHANAVRGIPERELTGTIDNLCINYNIYSGINDSELNDQEIGLFPNPSYGTFQIQLNKNATGIINVVNSVGAVVHQRAFSNQNTIDVQLSSSLNQGLYFVRIETQEGILTKKVVVNN